MKRVLVVDDQAENLYLLRALLEGHGYAVDSACNGAEALALARKQPPDVVVSDLMMPVLDGYMLLREWKADPGLLSIPFIVYTATYTDAQDERLALDLGADAFLLKPTEPEVLIARLTEILDRTTATPSANRPSADEDRFLLGYSRALIRKLQEKSAMLEQVNRDLERDIAARQAAEVHLEGTRAQLSSLVDSVSGVLYEADAETLRFSFVSPQAERLLGFPLSRWTEDPVFWASRLHADDRDRVMQAAREALAQRDRHVCEYRLIAADGRVVWIRDLPTFADEPGQSVRRRGLLIDITEQRQAEADRQASEERFRLVARATNDAIWDWDLVTQSLWWSEGFELLFGFRRDEVEPSIESWYNRVHPDDKQGVLDGVHRVIDGGGSSWAYEYRFLCKDGSYAYVLDRGHVIHDAAGKPVRMVGGMTDMTARKRNEEELRLRDRAIQAVSQGIVITDPNQPDNPIVYVSTGFERTTGYSRVEALGRNCRFLQGEDTDQRDVQELREAVAAARPCSVEILNYRKDGSHFWNHLTISPVLDPDGRLTHFVGVQNDVTERRRLEEQFRQAQKMEAIGQLAGGVAHDFNNLVTVIAGYSEILLSRTDLDPSIIEPARAIKEAGERAASLTRQLLGFSRQSMLQPRLVDLNAVITELTSMLRRLIGEDVMLSTVLDPGISLVRVDPGQLDQVLMNLAINARDAMPRGGKLTIETANVMRTDEYAATHLDTRPGPHVMLAMTDTGLGMPPEVQARIFEPFFTTKEIGRGTGLGLAMVFGIVQQSSGGIHVYSEPGRGTTFRLYFPAVAGGELPPAEPSVRPSARGTETILLVEDEAGVRRLAEMNLIEQGYRVLTAPDGRSALALADAMEGTIDLLLTDVVMPAMSGPEVAEQLRRRFPRIRVLYMSGYTTDAVVRHGLLEAEMSFIQKPYTPTALANKVRHVLDEDAEKVSG